MKVTVGRIHTQLYLLIESSLRIGTWYLTQRLEVSYEQSTRVHTLHVLKECSLFYIHDIVFFSEICVLIPLFILHSTFFTLGAPYSCSCSPTHLRDQFVSSSSPTVGHCLTCPPLLPCLEPEMPPLLRRMQAMMRLETCSHWTEETD